MDSDWASLPVNLLDSISEKIFSTRDYSQFGAVCALWQSVANSNAKKRISSSRHEVPLLMIQSQHGYSHDVYDVTNDRFLKSRLFVPFSNRFCGSSFGWLVSSNTDFSVTLHKPCFIVNGNINSAIQTIQLPCIDQRLAFAISKAVISADPLKNPEQCTVMVMRDPSTRLAYIRPSKDTAWSYIRLNLRKGHCADIIFYNDQFYAISHLGNLVCFEATEEPFHLIPKLIIKWDIDICGKRYLVESNGKLLHVERRLKYASDPDYKVSRVTERVTVYESDFDEKSWKESEGIGDHALFLGDSTSISVVASDFSGCKSNCIYFSHGNDPISSSGRVTRDFGVYDIHKRTFDLKFNMSADGKRFPIWIEPYH